MVNESPSTRSEADSLGSLELPADALYGIRTQRAVTSLSFSGRTLDSYPWYVRSLSLVKQAACRANRIAGVLDASIAGAIESACERVAGGNHAGAFPVDPLGGGGGIGINVNVNEVIANLANESLGKRRGAYDPVEPKRHVNASQSTADVCATAGRIAIAEAWEAVARELSALAGALDRKATDFAEVKTLARTCLQDAMPAPLGSLFEGYAALVKRCSAAADTAASAMSEVNLGGTVIGSGDGAPASYREAVVPELSRILGRPLRRRSSLFDAAQNIDDLAALSARLATLADGLSKVAQDLRLLASGPRGGFGEILLPATMEGSSFFPGKVNPVVPETLIHACIQVLACDRAVQLAFGRGELNLNVFEPVAVFNLLDALAMLQRAVRTFTESCVAGVRADEERCRTLAEGNVEGR